MASSPRRASLSTRTLTSTALLGLSAAALVLAGCDGGAACADCGETGGGGAGGAVSTGGAGGTVSTGGAGGTVSTGGAGGGDAAWSTLITGDWQLASGSELTSDVHTLTIEKDIYIGAIRPISPRGRTTPCSRSTTSVSTTSSMPRGSTPTPSSFPRG